MLTLSVTYVLLPSALVLCTVSSRPRMYLSDMKVFCTKGYEEGHADG